jgi:hypothetical protein
MENIRGSHVGKREREGGRERGRKERRKEGREHWLLI